MSLSEFFTAILNTLVVFVATLLLALPIGTLLAVLLGRIRVVGRGFAFVALGSQIAVPLYVFAGGWSAGIGTQGWLSSFGVAPIFGVGALQNSYSSIVAVSLIHALASIPWVVLIVSLGLSRMDRGQEEQALLEGGWSSVVRYVLLPKLRLWLLLAAIWVGIPILTEMVVTNLYQLPTIAEQVYLDASRGTPSYWTYIASVLSCVVPLAVAGGLVWKRGPNLRGPSDEALGEARELFVPRDLPVGRAMRTLASIFVWLSVCLFVGFPILSLIAKAGWKPSPSSSGATHYGWGLDRFLTTVRESLTLFNSEFVWSALLAGATATTALIVAITMRAVTRSKQGRWSVGVMMLTLLCVPGPLVGIAVIWLMNRSTPAWIGTLYDQTLVAPILAQLFHLLPLAWLMVWAILSSIPRSTWEAMKLEGINATAAIKSVVLPQTWRLWTCAWLALFVMSVGELSSSILVLPPGVTTVAMRLFEMLHFGMRHQDSGLCALLIIAGWVVSAACWKTLRDRQR